MRIFGVILAGGQARRMGGTDKALLPLNGQPLIRHVHDRLSPQVEDLAISANGDPARFATLGCPVLPDAASLGPLSGILTALHWASAHGADALVSAPVDAPFLPGDLVPHLLLAGDGRLAIASTAVGDHPVFALWPTALTEDLAAFLASGAKPKVTSFTDTHTAARARFPDATAFLNLNTPEDLALAETLLRGAK